MDEGWMVHGRASSISEGQGQANKQCSGSVDLSCISKTRGRKNNDRRASEEDR